MVAINTLPTYVGCGFVPTSLRFRKEGRNDLPKYFPSCYINVTVGLIFGQMSVSRRQYFLIRLQIVFVGIFRIHFLVR